MNSSGQKSSRNQSMSSQHVIKVMPSTGDYVESADYDPCREWLRLMVAFICLGIAAGAIYPIHLGVECFLDNHIDGTLNLSHCEPLFSVEYSLSILVGAVVIELITLFLFFYACRHEFCGVKRRYQTGLCSGGDGRPRSPAVHPMRVPPSPTYSY